MEDIVRGEIIGEILYRYEFWTENKPPRKICHAHFANDQDAIDWFKKLYSNYFSSGVEMRCYDRTN